MGDAVYEGVTDSVELAEADVTTVLLGDTMGESLGVPVGEALGDGDSEADCVTEALPLGGGDGEALGHK